MSYKSIHLQFLLKKQARSTTNFISLDELFSKSTLSLMQTDPYLTGNTKWTDGSVMVVFIRSGGNLIRTGKMLNASPSYAHNGLKARLEKITTAEFYTMVRAIARVKACLAGDLPDNWISYVPFPIKETMCAYAEDQLTTSFVERMGGFHCAADVFKVSARMCNNDIGILSDALELSPAQVVEWFDRVGIQVELQTT